MRETLYNFRGIPLRIAFGISMLVMLLASAGLGTNNHIIDLGAGDPTPTGTAIPVSSCINITTPGTYELTTNIVDSSGISCIQITSSNVIFNGKSHTIDGIDAENSYGVNVGNPTVASLTNVTVKNLIVTDWVNGIKYTKVTNGRIEKNNASSNTVGLLLVSSNNIILKKNIATMTPFGGCGIGIYDSNFNRLTGNRVNNNKGTGIILDGPSNYNTLIGNNASLNGDMGIWILGTSNHNDLIKNIVYENGFCCGGGRAGIAISNSNFNNLTRNTIKKNQRGVAIGSSMNIIFADNVIKNNTKSGLDIVLSSLIIK